MTFDEDDQVSCVLRGELCCAVLCDVVLCGAMRCGAGCCAMHLPCLSASFQ
jgi:hypothetical protein